MAGLKVSLFIVAFWQMSIPVTVNAGDPIFIARCPEKIESREAGVSRSLAIIDMRDQTRNCIIEGHVGGEHTSIVRVLGKTPEDLKLTFTRISGWAEYDIFPLEEERCTTAPEKKTGFEIQLWAYPYGEYRLILEKKPGKTTLPGAPL